MPSLKALKNRIASVKSTRKITKAMQMVAAAKLRRAQDAAEAARPYAERFNAVMAGLAQAASGSASAPRLHAGAGRGSATPEPRMGSSQRRRATQTGTRGSHSDRWRPKWQPRDPQWSRSPLSRLHPIFFEIPEGGLSRNRAVPWLVSRAAF